MATINIPDRHYGVLKNLSELSEAQFQELLKGLNEVETPAAPPVFIKHLAGKVKSIDRECIEGIIAMLCGLYPAKENHGKTASAIAADIKETAEEENPSLFTDAKATLLKERMEMLLTVDKAIAATAKANDVITEYPFISCGSRIFTDIRPIFSASADSVEVAAVVHTLNLSYHEGGKHKDFYVTMDMEDIGQLKEIIERAEKKAKVLKSIIQKSGVMYLEEEE